VRGGIGGEALRSLYSTAWARLYLARAEPLGLASLEVQACGSPVVVADEGGLPETIDPELTGFAVAREPAAAAAALDRLDDPAMRATMSAAAATHGQGFAWGRSG